MAYAALVSLEQTIDKLLHHHNHQCSISPYDKQQLVLIHDFVTSLQAFLENFPEKANTNLEGRIRDLANEAEDMIEFGVSDKIKLYHTLKSTAGSDSVVLHSDFKELKKVAKEIDSISGEVMKINNSTRTKDVQLSTAYSSVATSSSGLVAPTNKDPMVGFGDDLMAIKARLCGESQNLEVIPIFGMGGIGKTTLARNSYDDPLTVEHFDTRAWVTVSQDYSAQEIFSSLLVSFKAERSEGSNEAMVKIYKRLKGSRYLIVIDDIWSTKAWDDVKMIFPNDCNGSRIMMTTRLSDVAAYPHSSSPLHEMRFMNVDQSWHLLQQKVFAGKNCPPELETIGKEIARSCRGLPLAIVLIAGLLSTVSKTQASWGNIAENITSAIRSTNDEQFAKILSLSYIQLPHHLRPCFLYMGGYPEDYEISAKNLIKLWVAEGFSKPSESKSFEEVAEEYLEDLVKRSLILVTRRKKSNDKIKSCSIHDLVRDLCIRKANEEKFLLNVRHAGKMVLESIQSQRRVSVAHSDMHCLKSICGSTIRTIICFHHDGSSLSSLENSRLLRVLDMVPKIVGGQRVGIDVVLPAEVFELFHIRYLAFVYTARKQFVLPPSILNLQNLQTLNILPSIEGFPYIEGCLPIEIWRMRQLRHLIFRGPLPNIPQGAETFPLENLRTLSEAKDFKSTAEILEMIPNLKKLGIYYPGPANKYAEDYHLNNLVNLHRLESLRVTVDVFGSLVGKLNHIFPSTLKKLTLHGKIIPWKDMGIVGSLPNLQVLKLINNLYVEDKWETREGEFSQLKFLFIDLTRFRHWITESTHFPRLKRLVLFQCLELREIPDSIGEIPTLELIQIGHNPFLMDSARKLQEKQAEYSGDTTFQVRYGSFLGEELIPPSKWT